MDVSSPEGSETYRYQSQLAQELSAVLEAERCLVLLWGFGYCQKPSAGADRLLSQSRLVALRSFSTQCTLCSLVIISPVCTSLGAYPVLIQWQTWQTNPLGHFPVILSKIYHHFSSPPLLLLSAHWTDQDLIVHLGGSSQSTAKPCLCSCLGDAR